MDASAVRHHRSGEGERAAPGMACQQSTAGLVAPANDDAVAIEFVPSAVFDQTPGPEAGKPLEITR